MSEICNPQSLLFPMKEVFYVLGFPDSSIAPWKNIPYWRTGSISQKHYFCLLGFAIIHIKISLVYSKYTALRKFYFYTTLQISLNLVKDNWRQSTIWRAPRSLETMPFVSQQTNDEMHYEFFLFQIRELNSKSLSEFAWQINDKNKFSRFRANSVFSSWTCVPPDLKLFVNHFKINSPVQRGYKNRKK